MRQRVVPLLVPPLRKSAREGVGCYETKARGMAVLTTPRLNKGTAFTVEEREALGLTGLLPPVISTLEAQVGGRLRAIPAAAGRAEQEHLPDRSPRPQ